MATESYAFTETATLFAVGHMALGYLIGKASAKPLRVSPNVPLLLVLSIIPDMDILIGESFHRGPTHSVIAALIVFIPALVFYRKRAIPYLLALASHAVIGDLIIGGDLMLFWPLRTAKIFLPAPLPQLSIYSTTNMALELSLFAAAMVVMLKTRDFFTFFQPHRSNLLLAIPIITVLLPTFLGYPLQVPILLALPHFFYLVIFSIAVLRGLSPTFKMLTNLPNKEDRKNMAPTGQTSIKKPPRTWIKVTVSTAIVLALLAACAFLVTPQIFQPGEVMVMGTVTAQGVTLNRIVFVNTGCGTRTEAAITSTGENSGTYAVSLSNRYTYNVSIAWNNAEGALVETEIGALVLDSLDNFLVRDWTLQP